MKSTLVFIISVLLFVSTIFLPTTFAQQNPEVPVAKATSELDKSQAIAAAKADAAGDVNEWIWFATGAASGGAILCGGVMSIFGDPPAEAFVLSCGGYVGLGLSIGYGLFASATPDLDKLIGKSPEYVTYYVNTYVRSTKLRRNLSSASGCVGSWFIGIALLSVLDND